MRFCFDGLRTRFLTFSVFQKTAVRQLTIQIAVVVNNKKMAWFARQKDFGQPVYIKHLDEFIHALRALAVK